MTTISDKTSRARIYLPDNGHNHKTLQQVNIHVSTGLFGKNEKFAWRGKDGGHSLSRLISASSSRVPTPTAKTGRLRMPVPRLPGSLGSRILWVPPMRWLHTRDVKLSKWEERPCCWLVWMVAVLLIHGSQPRQLVQEGTIWQKLPGGFPGSSAGKESACQAGDPDSIPELGRSPGGGIAHSFQHSWACLVAQMVKNLPAMRGAWVRSQGWEDLEKRHGHPLQYSCLENGVAKSRTRLS